MKYIVATDLSDPAVAAAVQALISQYPDAEVADLSQTNTWAGPTPGDTMFMVGHGGGTNFDGYRNPADFFRDYPDAKTVFDASADIALVSCSTAAEAALMLKGGGFQAATFAVNLSSFDPGKTIHAAVGPVYADAGGNIMVDTPQGAEGFGSDEGWNAFEGGQPAAGDANPFK